MRRVWMAAIPEEHALPQFGEILLDRLAADGVITFAQRLHPPLYDRVLRLMQSAHLGAHIAYRAPTPQRGRSICATGRGAFLCTFCALPDVSSEVI